MTSRRRARLGRVVVASALTLGASACSKMFDADGALAGSVADMASCTKAYSASATRELPADLPVPTQTHVYEYTAQGQTQTWLTTVPGTSSQMVSLRDTIRAGLQSAGYVEMSEDSEPGAEADFSFAGPHIGSVQVRPLCSGRIRVRYAIGAGSL